ncbi:MAG TPA: ubiquinol-cytochrome c reductase cytochrome b subunit [Acidimicrobiales bacterium]|nr:ubiquinol-cytochrome c reductase cytochrome b subunit [Acidimicrobiales bacterium]
MTDVANDGMRAKTAAVAKKGAASQARHLDERLGLAGGVRWLLNYIFPDHWSFMLGEIALYSFIILIITGVYLSLFFVDSGKEIIYHGSYLPLRGVKMTEAYQSTIDISFNVRAGLVMRQMHHWAAIIFIGAIGIHMCRVFFTGAFRRPREINWTIGLTLMLLAVANGFFGYSLPDDLLSGTGLRIAYSVFESIPIIGTWIVYWLFGGAFPGDNLFERMLVIHMFVLPLLILGLLTAHLVIIMRQHHTQFPGKGATETNVVGTPMWPGYAAKSGGYFFMTFAVTAALAGVAQINPIWLYGPYDPYKVTTFAQPDWYIGWLEGSLRLMPNWETHLPGHMIPNAFFPGILLPGLIFNVLYAYPFIESYLTGDKTPHNLLDRPRDRPARAGFGAGMLTFFFILLIAGSDDLISVFLDTPLQLVVWVLRVLLFVAPVIVGLVTYEMCRELSKVPDGGKRKRANIIVRTADGAYHSVPSEPHPADEHHELLPAPVGEADLPVLVGAAMTPGRGGPPLTAPSGTVGSTAPSGIPGVSTVTRDTPPAPRPQRGLLPGFGLRRNRRPGNGSGGNGAGGGGGTGS